MAQGNYLNSVEAANLLGVNVSTIKRWTDSRKLNCIQTAGGHRKFLMKHINEYLDKQPNSASKITMVPYDTSEHRKLNLLIQKQKAKELKSHLLEYALKSNRVNVDMIITGLVLAQYPVYKIFDVLITPVMHKIGEMWEMNQITVAEEHIASNIIRDAILLIREIIIKPSKDSQKVICLALKDDQHDIPLKMVQILLEKRGFDVFYSGRSTPADSIEKLISIHKPARIYLSCTYFDDEWSTEQIETKEHELNIISNLAEKYKFSIYIGGQAFNKLSYNNELIKRRLYTFEEVYKY